MSLKHGKFCFTLLALVFLVSFFCIFPITTHASTLIKAPSSLGLVGYWSMNEGAGAIAHDFSGNGNNGSLQGSPTWVNGKLGQALSFNGTSQYLSLPSGVPRVSGAYTVSMWVKLNTLTPPNGEELITTDWSLYERNYLLEQNNNTIRLIVGNGGATQDSMLTSGTVTTGGWYHLVAVINGTTHTLYLNGISSASQVGSYSGGVTSNDRNIATDYNLSSGYFFSGSIDDVRIYNRALSAAEIAALYQSGAIAVGRSSNLTGGTLDNGLVGLWSFDGKDLSSTTAYDRSSGQGHSLMLENSPTPVAGKLGQALFFNGSGAVTNIGGTANAATYNVDNVTLSAWVNWKGTNGSDIQEIVFNGGAGNSGYGLGIGLNISCNSSTPTRVDVLLPGITCNVFDSTYNLPMNTWVHLVTIRSSGVWFLYVNGALKLTGNANNYTPIAINQDYWSNTSIGNTYTSNGDTQYPFNGSIDDVRIYNRALSAGEVQQLYNLGSTKYQTTDNAKGGGTLAQGLVGYWPFNGKDMSWASTTAAVVYDRSGLGNNGTTTGMLPSSAVPGKLGQALSFNGTNNYVVTGAKSDSFTNGLTLSAWVYCVSTLDGRFASMPGNNFWTGVSGGDFVALAYYNSNKTVDSGVAVANYENQWVLVTGIVDSSNFLHIFINGVEKGTPINLGGNIALTNIQVYIGSYTGGTGGYFNGSIDDVRIYNRALSAEEVKQLYNMGK